MPEFTPDEQVSARISQEEMTSQQLPLGVKNPLLPTSPLGQNFLSPKFIRPLGSQSLLANNQADYSPTDNIFQDLPFSAESQLKTSNSEAIQRSLNETFTPQSLTPENTTETQDSASTSRQNTPTEAVDTTSLKPIVVQPQLAITPENITPARESIQQIPLTEEPEEVHQEPIQDLSKPANPTPIVSSLQLRMADNSLRNVPSPQPELPEVEQITPSQEEPTTKSDRFFAPQSAELLPQSEKPSEAQSPQITVQAKPNFNQPSQILATENINKDSKNSQSLPDNSSEAIAQIVPKEEQSGVASANHTFVQAFAEDSASKEFPRQPTQADDASLLNAPLTNDSSTSSAKPDAETTLSSDLTLPQQLQEKQQYSLFNPTLSHSDILQTSLESSNSSGTAFLKTSDFAASQAPAEAIPQSPIETTVAQPNPTIEPELETTISTSEIVSSSLELPTPPTNESSATTAPSLQTKPNSTIEPELETTISTSEIVSSSPEIPTPPTNESSATTAPSRQTLESIQTKPSHLVVPQVNEAKPTEEPLTAPEIVSSSLEIPTPPTNESSATTAPSRQTLESIQTKPSHLVVPQVNEAKPTEEPLTEIFETPETPSPSAIASDIQIDEELSPAASTTEKSGEVQQPENVSATSLAPTTSANLLQRKATESITESVAQLPSVETTTSKPETTADIQNKSLGINQPSVEVTQTQDFPVAPSADSLPLNTEATSQSVSQTAATVVQPFLETTPSGDNQTLFPENNASPFSSEQTEPSLEPSVTASEPTASNSVAAMPAESLPSVTTPINPSTIQRFSEQEQLIISTASETAPDATLSNTPEPITTEDNEISETSKLPQSNDLAASETTTGDVQENARVTLGATPIALPNSTVSTSPENSLIQTQSSPATTIQQAAAKIALPSTLDSPSTPIPGEANIPHSSEENTSLSVVQPPLVVETPKLSTELADDPKIQLERSLTPHETAEVEAPSTQISPIIANNLLQAKTTENESFNQNQDVPQLPTVLENLIESRHPLPLSQQLHQPSFLGSASRFEHSESANSIQTKPENLLTLSKKTLEQPPLIQNQQEPSFNNSKSALSKATEQTVKLPPVSLKPEITIQKATTTNQRTTSRQNPENQANKSQQIENMPDSLSSMIESVPNSWASIAELIGEVNPDSPYSNVNPQQNLLNESNNWQQSNLLESIAEQSNYSNLASSVTEENSNQRLDTEQSPPQEDNSSVENPSAQQKDSGNTDSQNLERLAWEIYNLVRQRLAIERERYGNYYSDRLPW